jgi:hypothetical protein
MSKTTISIHADAFHINGRPTYEGRYWHGHKVEGLLANTRMVQGIFDDRNPETVQRWAYPDTGIWDAERNTNEFIAAMPTWLAHGVISFTINLQGGSPEGYSKEQPWHNSALEEDGSLNADYMRRLERILNRADELGMVPILGLFYFGQDTRLKDEAAIMRGVENSIDWIVERGYKNLLIEVNNECNVRYTHEILQPRRIHELIKHTCEYSAKKGQRLLVGTSYGGGHVPGGQVVAESDFVLIHGNGVSDPARIAEMVRQTRAMSAYRPMPILINEDDHFDFDKHWNNCLAALSEYCSWGYFDPGENDYKTGYQSVPTQWGLNTERKKAFFSLAKDISGWEKD